MQLLRQELLLCIFESPRSVAPLNSTRTRTLTEEIALFNLNEVVYAFVISIDGLSRARRIV